MPSLVPWSIVTPWAWRCVCPAGSVVAGHVAGGWCRAGRAVSAHAGIGTWADGGPTSVALVGLRRGTPSDGFISASWRLVVLLRRRWPIVPVSTPVSGDSHGSLTLAAAASLPGHAKGRDRPASVVRRQANCRVGNSEAEASPSGLWPAQVETSAVKSWSKSCGTLRVAGAEPLRGDCGRAPAEPKIRLGSMERLRDARVTPERLGPGQVCISDRTPSWRCAEPWWRCGLSQSSCCLRFVSGAYWMWYASSSTVIAPLMRGN